MPLLPKDQLTPTVSQETFTQEVPRMPEKLLRDYPELKEYDRALADWWFSVRTSLRRMQDRSSISSSGLSPTGVSAGTYGTNS